LAGEAGGERTVETSGKANQSSVLQKREKKRERPGEDGDPGRDLKSLLAQALKI